MFVGNLFLSTTICEFYYNDIIILLANNCLLLFEHSQLVRYFTDQFSYVYFPHFFHIHLSIYHIYQHARECLIK